jgi:hypothetical protein
LTGFHLARLKPEGVVPLDGRQTYVAGDARQRLLALLGRTGSGSWWGAATSDASSVHATRSIIQTGIAAVCESSLAQSEVATMTHAARNEFSDSAADASIMDRAFLSVVGRM